MPGLRVRNDFRIGEAAHLAADGLERLVESRIADHALRRFLDVGRKRRPVLRRVAALDERADRRLAPERRDVRVREAEIGEAHDFSLIHRDAAEDLRQIFAEPDPGQEVLGLAEPAFLLHPPGVGGHFPDRFDIGCEPGQAVDGMLFRFDPGRAELAARADLLPDGRRCGFQKSFGRILGLSGQIVERHGRFSLLAFCCVAPCFGPANVAMRLFDCAGRLGICAKRG